MMKLLSQPSFACFKVSENVKYLGRCVALSLVFDGNYIFLRVYQQYFKTSLSEVSLYESKVQNICNKEPLD